MPEPRKHSLDRDYRFKGPGIHALVAGNGWENLPFTLFVRVGKARERLRAL